MSYRIFYGAGPGDVIQAHKHWMRGEDDPSQVSITYSSQFAEFCRDIGAEAYVVSSHPRREVFRDGPFTLEHRPKPMPAASGALFHLFESLYGLSLLVTAVRFKADIALLHSGTTHIFVMSLFRLAGIRVLCVFHNTMWPRGFPPSRLVPRLINRMNSLFLRWGATAIIGVSPECIRQVEQLTRGRHGPLYQIRAQYRREYFGGILPPPPHEQQPFRILFLGRIDGTKGAFDVLEMARQLEMRAPGRFRFDLCGSGPLFETLERRHQEMNLAGIVFLYGWTLPPAQRDLRAKSHASIVPTRSSFAEGMAMTVIESILSGRPAITNPVVPALEVLGPACVEARTDDVESYVEAILKIADDPLYYHLLCEACLGGPQGQFYDGIYGKVAVLKQVIASLPKPTL